MRNSLDLQPEKKPNPLLGGNPASYWALPFDERCKHHALPGTEVRDVSKVGLTGNEDDGLYTAKGRMPTDRF